MDKILKTLVYNNEVSLAVLDITEMVNEGIKLHNFSPVAAAAFGRTLAVATYMCTGLKGENSALTVTINGNGVGGKIEVSGNNSLCMRGLVDNPTVSMNPNKFGKLDVGGFVGTTGYIVVVRDDGIGQPFVGTVELTNGEIAEDFVKYYAISEQIPTAIAVGVKIGKDGLCEGAGGVILQLLPNASEESIQEVEKVILNFNDISSQIAELGADGVADKYFGDGFYVEHYPKYKCNCSKEYISGIIKSIGKSELLQICEQEGKVNVHCHYCNTDYDFYKDDIEGLFKD